MVTLTTQNRQSPVQTVTTDGSGQGRLKGVMAAAVAARATLEGRAVQASSSLVAGSELTMELKAPDATLVGGAIRRAGAAVLGRRAPRPLSVAAAFPSDPRAA